MAKKIGLIGHSQGGWIAQIVAAQNPNIAFIVNVAGPTADVWDQNLQDTESDFICEGMDQEEIKTALKKRERELKTGRFLGKLLPFGDLGYWARIANFNSDENIRQLTCPTLFLFAENDSMVPPGPNLEHLESLFSTGVPNNIETVVVPETDHFFHFDDNSCFDFPETMSKPHSEIFYQKLDQWVDKLF